MKMPAKIAKILDKIGNFSKYLGMDGKPIYGKQKQSYLVKQMISKLSPAEGWQKSPLTTLRKPIGSQPSKKIEICAVEKFVGAFGPGKIQISKKSLAELADSSKIFVHQTMMPKALFLRIQKELRDHLEYQDKRNLQEILTLLGKWQAWQNEWRTLGCASLEHFKQIAETSLILLACGICHVQKVHFFVHQKVDGSGLALNRLRNTHLDNKMPNILISTPGLNLAYGGVKNVAEFIKSGCARQIITQLWENCLNAAIDQHCRYLTIPAIGLGAFAPAKYSEKIAKCYFDTLFELLGEEKYKDKFDGIFYNPAKFTKIFEKSRTQYQSSMNCNLVSFKGDVKFLAIEFAKANIRCALINPSDPDVMFGLMDVGEYYKNGHYVGEEDIAATSTAMLGSAGISDAYTNPKKVVSVGELHPPLSPLPPMTIPNKTGSVFSLRKVAVACVGLVVLATGSMAFAGIISVTSALVALGVSLLALAGIPIFLPKKKRIETQLHSSLIHQQGNILNFYSDRILELAPKYLLNHRKANGLASSIVATRHEGQQFQAVPFRAKMF